MPKSHKKSTKDSWFELDLSATVYPTLQRRSFSSVYRISALLKEKVKPDLLQKALEMTLPRFPTFKVALRKGIFWRYLEPNNRPGPWVEQDIINPCMPMPFHANNHYLIRVYYYENRISLEVFHSLSDGTGALYLLRTLIAVYLRLQGYTIPNQNGVLDINQPPDPEELEDAYKRYATSKVRPPRKQEKAYRLHGTLEPFYTLNIICGIISVDTLLNVAKKYKVTITEYLNSVLIYALIQQQKSENHRKERPIKIAMPVSLRRFFPSKTLRNFITMVYPTIDPRLGDYTFEEIVTQVHYYMRYHINGKFLNADITTNAMTKSHPVIRIVPLFIKDLTVRSFYKRVQDLQSSAGLTNLGTIDIPEEMREHLIRFDVLMGQPFSPRTNCAIASLGNILTINFASSIVETSVEKFFFTKLVRDGVPVKIETNRNN
ncbi:alcohol acetyltransferase [Anaerosacchariphilus polymeriproducens]|uniref:Alcohol acetyltransferase n=1 Tax=Anaerosacchariphilus polymeriproducens TaxID=1812858 RepID=A0A371AXQ7_9FIRM|nr:alcohol acetyltransferase [Anaerosacchariphilus polymeriproducens]RDU24346.1 alcohol acetyltransferase [Anaerosacchariphilus polymeriproducens]